MGSFRTVVPKLNSSTDGPVKIPEMERIREREEDKDP